MRDEFFYADGRTEGRKLMVAFRNFENVPKNETDACQYVNRVGDRGI